MIVQYVKIMHMLIKEKNGDLQLIFKKLIT